VLKTGGVRCYTMLYMNVVVEHVNTHGSPVFSSKTKLQMVRTAFCVGIRIEGGG